MAATQTVSHQHQFRNPTGTNTSSQTLAVTAQVLRVPRHGVVTLSGYGIKVHVDRGHLILEDGIGAVRRKGRLPRVRHGLRRLVVIGSDGMISLAALRWLADQKAAFVMLERDGSVLATTGPVRNSDARLRRAQASADRSDLALRISQELIRLKLLGQERIAREKLADSSAANAIAALRAELPSARTLDVVRTLEARAGAAYWIAWRSVKVQFPKKDLRRVPEHWLSFGSRTSPLSGFSPRLAINPLNAILNYLYAVLESETRLAVAELGLDPGIGFLHVDNDRRDSLAGDLMEVARPDVDTFLLAWVSRAPFSREWFFEQNDGNCRLMSGFAATLSETASTWRQAVAPVAEWLARTLWEESPKMAGYRPPANRLTQDRKRTAQGAAPSIRTLSPPTPQNLCRTCGAVIVHKGIYCRLCNADASKASYTQAADLGRKVALSENSQARRTETSRRNARAQHGWIAANHPSWLNQETYVNRILPRLSGLTVSAIASAIKVSLGYADSIRKGKAQPHARHWQALAELVGILPD
ncbi:MAG: CRISPR-associated endonuclease Cas1 [Acidobacteriota bacterium]|nr:CRISPR-associated endonuclease Cas1 [Acidobacteriota bacterium]